MIASSGPSTLSSAVRALALSTKSFCNFQHSPTFRGVSVTICLDLLNPLLVLLGRLLFVIVHLLTVPLQTSFHNALSSQRMPSM